MEPVSGRGRLRSSAFSLTILSSDPGMYLEATLIFRISLSFPKYSIGIWVDKMGFFSFKRIYKHSCFLYFLVFEKDNK